MKKLIPALLFLILFANNTGAQVKVLSWDQDYWGSEQGKWPVKWYDKPQHFARDYLLTEALHQIPLTRKHDWKIATLFNFCYEMLNGVKPYDKYGHVEGFSKKDFIAGQAGILYAEWKQSWPQKWRIYAVPLEIAAIVAFVKLSK